LKRLAMPDPTSRKLTQASNFSHIPSASYSLDMGLNMRAERDRNLTVITRHRLAAHIQGYKDDKWYQNC